MANTQELRLRAVLDTSDVQTKLNQLRQQQRSMQGNAQSGNMSNLGNLGNLGSTLMKLNSTLVTLTQAIRQMGVKSGGNASNTRNIPFIPPTGRGGQLESFDDNAIRERLKALLKTKGGLNTRMRSLAADVYNKNSRVGQLIADRFGINLPRPPTPIQLGPQQLAEKLTVNQVRRHFGPLDRYIHSQVGQEFLNRETEGQFNKRIFRGGVTMLVGGLGQSVADFANAYNPDSPAINSANAVLGSVGKIATYAGMGAMMGPHGALIGAFIGSLEALFDTFTKKLTEERQLIEQEAQKWTNLRKANTAMRKVRKDERENEEIYSIIKSGNSLDLESKRNSYQKKLDWINSRIAGLDESMSKGYTLGETDLARLENLREQKGNIQSKLNQIEQAQLQKQTQANAYIAKRTAQRATLAGIEVDMTHMANSQYNTGVIANGARYGELAYNYNSWLGLANGNTKEINDLLLKSKDKSLSNGDRQKIIDRIQLLQGELSFNSQEAGKFGSAAIEKLQQQLQRLVAPDMSNVNSLAQYGFGVSSRDDVERLNAQQQYQTESLNLQRQIKNNTAKLQTGSAFGD